MGMFGRLTQPLDPRVQALVSGNPLPAAPLSPSAKRRINATPTEKQVYKMFGMEPGVKRPALVPMPSNMARTSEPINWKDWTAPSALYDLARAVVSPSVADQMTPQQMQEEARNTAWSIPAASVAAAAPMGMFGRGVKHDPNTLRMSIGPTERKATDAIKYSDVGYNPAFTRVGSSHRKMDVKPLSELTVHTTGNLHVPTVDLRDYAGRPFITSMSDRTAAGKKIVRINDVNLDLPVELHGGQEYPFMADGQAWASEYKPSKAILAMAQHLKSITGQNPLFLPWRMQPSGSDFSHMTAEVMMNHAGSAFDGGTRKALNAQIEQVVPGFSGVGTEEGLQQFYAVSGQKRKLLNKMLDKFNKQEGGIGLPEARLAITDANQLNAPWTGLQGVSEIDPSRGLIAQSGHPSYNTGVPGTGLGMLDRDIPVLDMLPNLSEQSKIVDPWNPPWQAGKSQTGIGEGSPIRAMMMKPYGDIISDDILRKIYD